MAHLTFSSQPELQQSTDSIRVDLGCEGMITFDDKQMMKLVDLGCVGVGSLEGTGFVYMCQGLNSHYFRIIGDKVINPIVGVKIGPHYKDSVIKGGRSPIPKKTRLLTMAHMEMVCSHIFRDSYGSGMGTVWEAYHKGVPSLGVPENPTDRLCMSPKYLGCLPMSSCLRCLDFFVPNIPWCPSMKIRDVS